MHQLSFKQWDIVSRDGTDRQLVYNITPQQLHMVCIKPSECDYMQADNWVVGEVESNVPWRYELVSKCLTPEKLLKQIGRSDLWEAERMNKMNVTYYECIEIMKEKSEELQKDFNKMVNKWETESNLRREQAYYSFQGARIYVSENKMMSTAEAISHVLSYSEE